MNAEPYQMRLMRLEATVRRLTEKVRALEHRTNNLQDRVGRRY